MNETYRSTLRMGAFLIISCCCIMAAAQDIPAKSPKQTIRIENWLAAGPLPAPLAAFSSSGDRPFGAAELLNFDPVDVRTLRPRAGGEFLWADGSKAPWRALAAGDKGAELAPSGGAFETAYLAAFIDASRWTPARVSIVSSQPFQAYLDGRSIASRSKAVKPDNATAASDGRVSADIKLDTGQHLLVIKSLYDRSAGAQWSTSASLEGE